MFDIAWKNQTHSGTSGTGGKASGVSDGAMGPNRIIFSGTEDMGGGLKAMFMSEIGVNPTNDELLGNRTGNSAIQWDSALNRTTAETAALKQGATGYTQNTNRQTWVGVTGGFGHIRAGYLVNNIYVLSSQSGYNQTFEGLLGADVFHIHGNTIVGGTRGNGVQYTTPELMSGLTATIQYGAGNGRQSLESGNGDTKDNLSRTGIKFDYASGPLKAAYARTEATTVTTNSILTANAQGETVTTPSAADAKGVLNQYIASYNFGPATVAYLINDGQSTQNIASGSAATAVSIGAVTKMKSNQLTVSAPMGKITLRASVGKLSTDTPYTSGTLRTVDVKGSQYGGTYELSKRTVAYLMQGKTEDTGTSASVWNAKRTSTAFGINHTF